MLLRMRLALTVVVVLCGCPPPDSPAQLSLRPMPPVIDGVGQTSTIIIEARLESGAPGSGVVSFASPAHGAIDPASVTLDPAGAGTALFSCVGGADPGCFGRRTITATWSGLTRDTTVQVGVVDGGLVDGGTRAMLDGGCRRAIKSFGARQECPLEDGGVCVTDHFSDGGSTSPSCEGREGDPCFSDLACRASRCQRDRCACTRLTACGDGGLCIDLGANELSCSTRTPGSRCSDNSHCAGGTCVLVPFGSRVCTQGRLGQPCALQADCVEGTCVQGTCR